MYAKLALRNIRRSLRDYGIYFLTLVFAVAIFYVFNSLGDQPAVLGLRDSTRRMAQGALEMMSWLTIITTGVVALLVLYANRVIIKKRSRELGTYLLLGMEQGRLAGLLLAEIVTIGMAAMATGLVFGIFLSQLFALVVSKMFQSPITGHPFVFSGGAALRTIAVYGLTFVLVGVLQAISVYRHKLIDLITGVSKNEVLRLRNPKIVAGSGLLGALSVGWAYWLADQVSRDPGINPTDPRISTGAVLGVMGTYLLFVAASGLLVRMKGRRSGWMSRGLNRFVYRQVTSKINTHATMLGTITLMLTFTFCAMSFGLGLGRGMTERAKAEAPFDYLAVSSAPAESFAWVREAMDRYGVAERSEVQVSVRRTEIRGMDQMLLEDRTWFEGQGVGEFILYVHANVISAADYHQLRSLLGYEALPLQPDQYLIHFSGQQTEHARQARRAYERFMASGASLTLGGQSLQPGAARVYTEPFGDNLAAHAILLVVPDELAEQLEPFLTYLAVQVPAPAPGALDEALRSSAREARSGEVMVNITIAADVVGQSMMMEGVLLLLTSYVGVMFVLISATLMALQQLTDAVEYRQRFAVLRKLGADEQMIDGAIARQVGLYFLSPVAVALVHSLVAMAALARVFQLGAGYTTVWSATLVTLGVSMVIYGAYYLLTVQSCRTLFTEAQPQ